MKQLSTYTGTILFLKDVDLEFVSNSGDTTCKVFISSGTKLSIEPNLSNRYNYLLRKASASTKTLEVYLEWYLKIDKRSLNYACNRNYACNIPQSTLQRLWKRGAVKPYLPFYNPNT